MALSTEDQKLKNLFMGEIDKLEELLNMREKYGVFRFFCKDFWKLIKPNLNRLNW